MRSIVLIIWLALTLSPTTSSAQRRCDDVATNEHCAGIRDDTGVDTVALPQTVPRGGQASVSFTMAGLRPSSAELVGRSSANSLRVRWRAGFLTCVRYTVKYCYIPR
jgi:hypothetical protein